jgi:osmotically-inducible protein OsmY
MMSGGVELDGPLAKGSQREERIQTTTEDNDMMQTLERNDTELKEDVLSELKYEPGVKVTDIGVLVKDGTVTLNGFVPSYWEKWNAVRAAKRVAGVSAIADDIEVHVPDSLHRTDGEIATSAEQQVEFSSSLSPKKVKVTVRDGWVTMDGEVEWWYQKNDADKAVRHVQGVKGVTNGITIKPVLSPTTLEESIQSAFKRSAVLDSNHVHVETSGSTVTLRGKVRNYAEKDEAQRTAWAAPGVAMVENKLTVIWPWSD